MTRLLYLLLIIFLISVSVQGQVTTLKDSLLEKYTMEELKSMSTFDFGNAVRMIRGLEPLSLPKEPEYDFYGVKIIKKIPADSMQKVIDERVAHIKGEKNGCRQEVFPNAWRDVVEGVGLNFYQSISKRIVKDRNRESMDLRLKEMVFDGRSVFSDFSRRIYYYNQEGSLRLITREMGYNIISGEPEDWEDQMEKVYYYEERYVWDDTLQYSTLLKCKQYVGGYPDYTTQEAIDTTLALCKAWSTYHYKNNCFNFKKKEGEYFRNSWREDFEQQPFEKQGTCENGAFISLRNLLEEREEYYSKENDYLQPVPTSEWQPYVIEGKWQK